jgi:hypothetical protein
VGESVPVSFSTSRRVENYRPRRKLPIFPKQRNEHNILNSMSFVSLICDGNLGVKLWRKSEKFAKRGKQYNDAAAAPILAAPTAPVRFYYT